MNSIRAGLAGVGSIRDLVDDLFIVDFRLSVSDRSIPTVLTKLSLAAIVLLGAGSSGSSYRNTSSNPVKI